jgi:CBS domain containing-hemolysin-like protein
MASQPWIFLGVALVVDILIASARAALANVRPANLMAYSEKRTSAVDRTLALLQKPRLGVAMRTGVVIIHFLLALAAVLSVQTWFPEASLSTRSILLLVVFFLLVITLEAALEGRILRDPERWALNLAWIGTFLNTLLTPITAPILGLLNYGSNRKNAAVVTESDLRSWVEEGSPSQGALEQGERQMIYSIFRFGQTLAREIMVPRIDIVAVEFTTLLSEAVEAMTESGHSRIPVYEETVDNIVGLLYAKDLLKVERSPETVISSMRSLLRPVYYVPEAKKVDELLTEMQSQRIHMAMVVDEYGGIAGLVTLEDILEEIIGEIQDEYDQAEEMLYQEVNPDEYVFQGRIDLGDFNDVMGSHLSKDSAETLGGFIYGEVGRVPVEGETVEVDGLVLTVEQVLGRRIRKVRARRQVSSANAPSGTSVPEAEEEKRDPDE